MKTCKYSSWSVVVLSLGVLLGAGSSLTAQPLRTQTLQLQTGWNAVFLEVEPPDPQPEAVFAGLPVDIVARYFETTSPVQFISNPDAATWKQPGWGVWYAPHREDAFLKSLHAIHGNKAYLIFARQSCVWTVEGTVSFSRVRWQADSFNLVGFSVSEQSPPTFGKFFAGSRGLIGHRIYRLSDGKWLPVANPAATPMRAGEACWVYCRGKTDYQGPLQITLPGVEAVDFGAGAANLEVGFRNTLNESVRVFVEPVSGGAGLPLSYVVRNLAKLETTAHRLEAATEVASLAAGQLSGLRLQARREAMTAEEQTALLKISTDTGAQCWIPVRARRATLAAQP